MVTHNSGVALAGAPLEFTPKRGRNGLRLVFAIDSDSLERYCGASANDAPIPDDDQAQPLRIPDVRGLTPLDAALAYAEAGWYLVPIDNGTKNPGSIVHGGWQDQCSRDPEQLRLWWTDHPDAGIAVVPGKSGAVVFDMDKARGVMPDTVWSTLREGRTQRTREHAPDLDDVKIGSPDEIRRHFVFACEADSFRNAAGGFMRYGDVKCKNGVIIVEPSTHAKADEGGLYRWESAGVVPELPDVLRDLLSKSLPGDECADPKSLAELAEFLATYDDEDRPHALKGQLTTFASETSDGASRHESMCKALVWAFREAIVGCYGAQRAYDELRAAFETVKPESVAGGEFDRLAKWAAAQAELADPEDTRTRLNRDVWPAPETPLLVAQRVAEHAEAGGRPLKRWRGGWHRWDGSSWPEIVEEHLRADLYQLLANVRYLKVVKGVSTPTNWNPDKGKLDKLIDALKGTVSLPDATDAPCWLDGRADQVIAFGNTLIRLTDRAEIDCTATYFNTFALPFDYDPTAPTPVRWLAFLASVWPSDPDAISLLQEWFGYVISGRTDLQKMLLMIGPTRSGKGTIDKTLAALVGRPRYLGMSAKLLQGDFGLEPLLDKALVVFSDDRVTVNGKALVENILKITGEDPVTVSRKYRQSWAGQLPARLMLMSNEVPTLPDNSRAIVGRMLCLRMTRSFLGREDQTLAKALVGELPGILLWALDGLDRVNARQSFTEPASGAVLGQMLSDGAAPIVRFAEESCVMSAGDEPDARLFVSVEHLFKRYSNWCAVHGHAPGTDTTMGKALFSAFGNKIKIHRPREKGSGKQIRGYQGISLKPKHPRIVDGG